MKKLKGTIFLISILLFSTLLSGCSTYGLNKHENADNEQVEFQSSNTNPLSDTISNKDYQLTSDLNNDGQIESIRLLFDNKLLMEIDGDKIVLGDINSVT